MMNVLHALVLAYQLSAILTSALAVIFPVFTFKDLLATASNGTEGPVPSTCQSICTPIVPYAIDGQSCTPQTCCTSTWEQSYYSCILCAAQAQGIIDLSPAQATLDGIHADCAASGISLPLLTFPGQSTNRTLPSASILPSGTVPATGTVNATSVSASGNATAATSSGVSSTSSAVSPTQSRSAGPSSIQIPWSSLVALAIFNLVL